MAKTIGPIQLWIQVRDEDADKIENAGELAGFAERSMANELKSRDIPADIQVSFYDDDRHVHYFVNGAGMSETPIMPETQAD